MFVQSAESSPAAARSDGLSRHRETPCRQVRRQSSKQRAQRSTLHPRTDAQLPRPLRRRRRPQRLGSPGENTAVSLSRSCHRHPVYLFIFRIQEKAVIKKHKTRITPPKILTVNLVNSKDYSNTVKHSRNKKYRNN